MKKNIKTILLALIAFFSLFTMAQAQVQGGITVPSGGTGLTSVPANYVLIGNTANNLTAVATSSLGLGGSGGGSVNQVNSGTGLTGGPITNTGTISLDLTANNTFTGTPTYSNGIVNNASSTGSKGFNISGGCFAINGVCTGSSSGTGITTLNGQTGPSQTFATTTVPGGFGFTSTSNIHTLNLPPASDNASGTESGFDFQKSESMINVKSFGAVGDGVANDLSAIQQAVNFASSTGGGNIYFPCGNYFVTGNLTNATGTSASLNKSLISLPVVNVTNQKQMRIAFIGCQPPSWNTNWTTDLQPLSTAGTIISTTKTSANATDSIIGNAGPGGSEGNVNGLGLYIRNITFRTYDNPQITPINCGWMGNCDISQVEVDTGTVLGNISQPTHGAYGIIMPYSNNWTNNPINDVNIMAYNTDISMSEHTTANDLNLWSSPICIQLPGSYHALYIGRVLLTGCGEEINADGTNPGPGSPQNQYLVISEMATEHTAQTGGRTWMNTTEDLNDPSNFVYGSINFLSVTSNIGTTATFTKNGGANVSLYNMFLNTDTNLTGLGISTTTTGTPFALGSGANAVNISGTATSTFSHGINLLNGCLAIAGLCSTGGGGGSGTVNSGTVGSLSWYATTGTAVSATTTTGAVTVGAINATNPAATTTLQDTIVGPTTASSTFTVDYLGHIMTGGLTPTCSSGCATAPSIWGSDSTIRLLTGTSVTSVTVTFASPWVGQQGRAISPACSPTDASGVTTGIEASTSPTTLTLSLPTALTTKYVTVQCQGDYGFQF